MKREANSQAVNPNLAPPDIDKQIQAIENENTAQKNHIDTVGKTIFPVPLPNYTVWNSDRKHSYKLLKSPPASGGYSMPLKKA